MSSNSDHERRYIRQTMLAEVGETGQVKLAAARVLVVGAGGLGSAMIPYLAAAGVGTLGIIDPDRVELSNLARQVIHETGDIGRLKVESARDRVSELNPDVAIIIHPDALTAQNAIPIIGGETDGAPHGYDIVADGCDNFATRLVVNQACVALKKPLVSAAAIGWEGQLMSFNTGRDSASPCYQCFLHPDAPEANTCRESGVIGPLVGMVGAAQALEVLRMILGIPALIGKVAIFDGKNQTQRLATIPRDPRCTVCAKRP
ncbi:MAG: HesA/MoeB/ThiF family protein [Alphaproteobacteria bacterium]|jgi:adenylyltransferase/sulfurtransferase